MGRGKITKKGKKDKSQSKSKRSKQRGGGRDSGDVDAFEQRQADHLLNLEHRKQRGRARRRGKGKGDPDAYNRSFIKYSQQVGRLGLFIRDVKGDGNCMFRSVADQLYSQEHRHAEVRTALCNFVDEHRPDFEPFVEDDEDFDVYLARMRTDGEWGGNFELAAVVRCFGVHVIVHQLSAPRYQLTNHEGGSSRTIHLSYHDGEHYNSVRVMGDEAHDGPAREIPKELKLNAEKGSYSGGATSSSGSGSGPGTSLGSDGGKCSKKVLPSDVTVVSRATGCKEMDRVREVLADCDGDVDAAIEVLVAMGNVGVSVDNDEGDYEEVVRPEVGDRSTSADAGASTNCRDWESAAFAPVPKKCVTQKERKAEANRLREAKKKADQVNHRENQSVAENIGNIQLKKTKKKKLSKREKREEKRQRAAAERRQASLHEEGSEDNNWGEARSGGLDEALTTLAI